MRQAFIETLSEIAKEDKTIYLLTADLGFSVLEGFKNKYTERFLNMGVSETNMVGVAAGMALSGKTVFIYSIIPFVTARVFEHIRNDVAMQNANVKIVGVGSGLSYGSMGATHHAIEDISIMRTLPQMTVICPGDPIETREATKSIAKFHGPCYLRINKNGDPVVHKKNISFKIGRSITVKNGKGIALIATGNMLPVGQSVCAQLATQGIDSRLISMHTIKPLDSAVVKRISKETRAIFTLEEHNIIGGLGSAVSEILAESSYRGIFRRFGINDVFTHIAASAEFLRHHHKISHDDITKRILKILS